MANQTPETLASVPTPQVDGQQLAMNTAHAETITGKPVENVAAGPNVKCVVVDEPVAPVAKECGYEIVVQAPEGKAIQAYLVSPGAHVILKGIDISAATMVEEGDNLRITTVDGGQILLLDYVAASKTDSCTKLVGDEGDITLAAKHAEVEPAAGPTTTVRAAAPRVADSGNGFQAPGIIGNQFGFGDQVLSSIIGPFAIPFGRDSIEYKEFPTDGTPPAAPVPPVVNTPPDARDDTATVSCGVVCGHSVTINALANDTDANGDPLTITGISGLNPALGTASVVGNQIVFTPASGVTGPVTFQYSISDGNGGTDTANITVNVTNTPPDAVDDAASTQQGTPVTINVLANDTDAECTPGITITGISGVNPAQGTAQLVGNQIVFTPAAGFTGTASFQYSISDGCGASDTATVTVTVTPVQPPNTTDANNDTASTTCGNAVTIAVLANDTDIEGDTTTITGTTNPANGTIVVNPDGTITYTPITGFIGVDTFTYTVTDARGATDTATVSVTVTNTPPDAVNDTASTAFNTPVVISVLANDSDAESAVALDGIVTGPAHGVAVVNPDGTITYTPNAGFTGTDTFTYRIDDACGATDVATVTVTVGANPNTAPDAVDDVVSTTCVSAICGCGATATIHPLANDTDPEGDTLTITAVGTAAHGTVVLNADGTISYRPEGGFVGTDSFTYTISDGNGGTDTATIFVTVTNEPPVAVDDAASTAFQTPVSFNVLTNDSDPSGGRLKFDGIVGAPAHGTVSVDSAGNVTYTPANGFTGTDTFTYRVVDGCGAEDVATVTITVGTPPNTPPDATNDVATAVCDCAPVTINVLANDSDADGDTLTVTRIVSGPAHGVAVINAGGTITYTPAHGWQGEDFFQYEISDGNGGTDIAQVKVVTINNAPDAVNDSYNTVCGTPVTFNVLTNDSDPDACQTISIASNTQPAHGTVVFNANGTYTYTPAAGFTGTDSFTYTIDDGCGGTDTATVTVTVTNTPPDAQNDTATVSCGVVCGHSVTINVLANDTDADGHALTLQSISGLNPAQGTAQIVNGQVVFTPASGFTGTATFTYTVKDSCGATDTATVTVNVTNTPPDARDDNAGTIPAGGSVTTNVLANDTDAECTPGIHVISATANPAQGTVTVNADNTITFHAATGFSGTATYTYTIADGCGGTDTATVTVVVEAAPPPPPPPPPVSPIVIDLNGDGIHTIAAADSHAQFDLFADGTPEHTAWFSGNDGILVRDENGDGIINDINEMFGTDNPDSNGYETLLAEMDSNGDGVIDANDEGFEQLQLWVDANEDGVTDAGELHSLADFGIVSINATPVADYNQLTDDSFISHTSTVTLEDGSTLESADVWFHTANDATMDTVLNGGNEGDNVADAAAIPATDNGGDAGYTGTLGGEQLVVDAPQPVLHD
ncbi:MAG: tandem-95 repeat protein [Pseudomonadaceae bacterium]|nr:tandem-95 repeat protein [Pseudomonadaceae bacterium]